MRVLNDLRKLTAEQRKELLKTIENEEQLEEEALKKNPNLHLERKMQLVLNEIKELKQEMQTIQKNKQNNESKQTNESNDNKNNTTSNYNNVCSCSANASASANASGMQDITMPSVSVIGSKSWINEQPFLKCYNSKCCLDVSASVSDNDSISGDSICNSLFSRDSIYWFIIIISFLYTISVMLEPKGAKRSSLIL
jgi:alanyl-tRNA synthetase